MQNGGTNPQPSTVAAGAVSRSGNPCRLPTPAECLTLK